MEKSPSSRRRSRIKDFSMEGILFKEITTLLK